VRDNALTEMVGSTNPPPRSLAPAKIQLRFLIQFQVKLGRITVREVVIDVLGPIRHSGRLAAAVQRRQGRHCNVGFFHKRPAGQFLSDTVELDVRHT
jgi:hypothetical protein